MWQTTRQEPSFKYFDGPKADIIDHKGLCCTNRLMAGLPFSRTDLSHGLRDGDAEGGVAVENGDTNLELRHLTVEVSRHEALTQQFRFADLRFTQCILVSTRLLRW